MNKICIFIILLLFAVVSYSQETENDSTDYYQSYPDKDAKEAVSKIVKYTGLEPDFVIISANVKTVVAYIKSGKRYIAYNPEFIKRLKSQTQTDWAAVGVLAHEIGHHLLGHTLVYKVTNPGNELAAEKFAGFIMYKMGATLDESISAIESVGHELDSIFHPPKPARIDAVKNGWQQAKNLDNTVAYKNKGDKNVSDTLKVKLIYKCSFKTDENIYFVDEKDQIIWFDNYGNPIVLGYKMPSDSPNYSWKYTYGEIQYYIDHKGDIWNIMIGGTAVKAGKTEKISD